MDGSPPPGAGTAGAVHGNPGETGPPALPGQDGQDGQDGTAAAGAGPDEDELPDSRNFLVRGASAAGLRTGRVVHGTGRMDPKATSAEGAA